MFLEFICTVQTPDEDRKHARLMANILDIRYIEVSIDTISNEFLILQILRI